MGALIQNELLKIFAKKSSFIYPILLVVFILLSAILYNSIFDLINAVPSGMDVTVESPVPEEPTIWNYLSTFAVGITSFITLFSVIVGSQNVAAEFGDGTIKQLLIRPHRRWKILLSKFIAVNLYSILLTIVFVIFSYLIGLLFFDNSGFSNQANIPDVMPGSTTVTISEGALFFKTLLYFLPGLLMINTISFMLSTLFKSQALAVGVGIFVLFVNSTLSGVLTLLMNEFNWFKYLPFPHLDLTPYAMFSTMNDLTVGYALTVLTIYFLGFIALTFTYFQKRDISF